MIKFFCLLITFSFAQVSLAQVFDGKSAARQPGVSYKAYEARAQMMSQFAPFAFSRTPVQAAEEFGKATLPEATAWESQNLMIERFKHFRDLRFLNEYGRPNFLRRSTWLYPDDGCFARAALANRNLSKLTPAIPNKVFVFGDLNVQTKNAPDGFVTWWYHVAPLVEVDGQKYVLDPAIEPSHPLKLEEWLATMSSTPQTLKVAVCGSGTYTPYDNCATVTDGKEQMAETDQAVYFDDEWERLETLNRNPEQELGDNPPWN